MKRISNIIVLAAILLFVASSCSDFLEPEFENNTFSDEYLLTHPINAEGLLLNGYASLPGDEIDLEAATDNATTNVFSSGYLKMGTGQWTSNFNPVSVWTKDYMVLRYINKFEGIYKDVKWEWQYTDRNPYFLNRFAGEIFGLRAWYLYDLLKVHGGESVDGKLLGVPIILKELNQNDDLKLPRNTFDECIARIVNDCDSAISRLPFKYANGSANDAVLGKSFDGRVDQKVAMVIKSRATLMAASPAFTIGKTDAEKIALWQKAANAAAQYLKLVSGATGFSARGVDFYKATFQDDPEIIWRKRVVASSSTLEKSLFPPSLYGNGTINPSQNLVDAFPLATGYPATAEVQKTNLTLKDKRLQAFVIYQGSKLKNIAINTYVGAPNDGMNILPTSTRTGYYLKKFVNESVSLLPTNVTGAAHFITLARRTEIFLNYAEAVNEAYGPDADPLGVGLTPKAVLGLIRKRAGIDSNATLAGYQDQFLDDRAAAGRDAFRALIKNERRVELCFEGTRFWDIRRWKDNISEPLKGVSITNNGGTLSYSFQDVEARPYKDYMYYGPVPYTETLKYDIKQNKGW
ncbi:MAG: RagB/SusD family nutrient uptake outer membrane protein [Prolixibacteraceae bacterium]|jgi:hypothetical protein|nr:RagB/SusD family nutrient uptake outer membrane protein [Prolixibacteraceae bacterium]